MTTTSWTLALSLVALLGCEAKAGERCDGFFSNGCKAPATCVTDGDKAVCGVTCDTHLTGEKAGQKYCKDPAFQPVEVQVEGGGSMGCHCIPK